MTAYYDHVLAAIENPTYVSQVKNLGKRKYLNVVLPRNEQARRVHYYCVYLTPGQKGTHIMAKAEILEKKSLSHLLKAVSHLVQLPRTQMRLDYDEEDDVLYVHFDDRTVSTHTLMRDAPQPKN
jgi:hypothetical protein